MVFAGGAHVLAETLGGGQPFDEGNALLAEVAAGLSRRVGGVGAVEHVTGFRGQSFLPFDRSVPVLGILHSAGKTRLELPMVSVFQGGADGGE